MENIVAKGSYGKVIKRDMGGMAVAQKIYLDTATDGALCPQEIDIMCKIRHPNIMSHLKLEKVFNPVSKVENISIIMPFAEYGTLNDLLFKNEQVTIINKIEMIFQLVCAIKMLHDNYIIHLDIKCQNILVYREGYKFSIKLIDFGTSQYSNSTLVRFLNDDVVTINFRPPENMIARHHPTRKRHGNFTDIWTLGIVSIELLKGRGFYTAEDLGLYTDHDHLNEPVAEHGMQKRNKYFFVMDKVQRRKNIYSYLDNLVAGDVKNNLVDFLTDVLNLDPDARPTINQILKYKIFEGMEIINGSCNVPKLCNSSYDPNKLLNTFINKVNLNLYYALDRLFKIAMAEKSNCRSETVFLALTIFWRYLFINQNFDSDFLTLLINTSYFLAHKMIEQQDTVLKFPKEEILQFINLENNIIMTFNGIIYPVNLFNRCCTYPMFLEIFEIFVNPIKFYQHHSIFDSQQYDNWFSTNFPERSLGDNIRHFKECFVKTEWYEKGDVGYVHYYHKFIAFKNSNN